jgi:molecular chaperone GrpE
MIMFGESEKEPVGQQHEENHTGDSSVHKEHKKEKFHKLHEQIDELKAEKDELFAKLQRVSADYMNYQKRSAKQISETIIYEKEAIIKSFLPVLDNFEHTLNGAEGVENIESLRKGIKIIYDQMLSILKNYGVEQIGSVGQKFDPSCHQAMLQKTESDKEDGIILEEFQKGYRLGKNVLRPSRVVVNKQQPDKSDTTKQQDGTKDVEDGD